MNAKHMVCKCLINGLLWTIKIKCYPRVVSGPSTGSVVPWSSGTSDARLGSTDISASAAVKCSGRGEKTERGRHMYCQFIDMLALYYICNRNEPLG
jgi:hypothetical protein